MEEHCLLAHSLHAQDHSLQVHAQLAFLDGLSPPAKDGATHSGPGPLTSRPSIIDMATGQFGMGKHNPLHPLDSMLCQIDKLQHEVVVCVCDNIMWC